MNENCSKKYYRLSLCYAVSCIVFLLFFTQCQEPDPPQSTTQLTVLEYRPAMGQFVNILPAYQEGDTHETMCLKAQALLRDAGLVTLGGFGGYITISMGAPVTNINGYDFQVLGNAFLMQGDERYGSSEPGIVLVSQDINQNGLPDDPWYELAGSEYYRPSTVHHYRKTWYKSDTTLNNTFHTQPYFPQWLTDTIIEVEGTCLASQTEDLNGVFAQRILLYGYADNKPNNDDEGISFDLDWAVDDEGKNIQLQYCDFIRIMTAVDEVYPRIGELSTEVAGVKLVSK